MILQNGKRIDGCSDTVPVGTLQPYLGLVPPKGYLVCQGQLVSKITYSKLYEICGDTFGTSTETHFYLPDLRGKTLAGYDENDAAMNTIGKLLGQKTHSHTTGNHTLTIDEMPAHNHHFEVEDGDRTEYDTSDRLYLSGSAYPTLPTAGIGGDWYSSGTVKIQTAGGSQPHNHGDTGSSTSYQPTITVNWIVKAVMLIPDYIIVEDTLASNSATDALSARQGKLLNEKFTDYATKSEMIQYLPLGGGALSGGIQFPYGLYQTEDKYGLDMNNSDIINVNSLYWCDTSNTHTEGLNFKRTNDNWDTITGYDGNLYWYTNSTDATPGTQNVILGTHNTKDYIVEYGTSGNWRYRKWSSGTAECWGKFVHANALPCTKQWGILWETDNIGTTDVPNYPISFTDIPSSCIECQGTSMAYLSLERSGASKTHIGNIYLTRPDGASTFSAGFTITIYAIGRWK